MSSSQSSDDYIDTSEEEISEEGTPESEAVVETVECPNCERRFVGEYCPDCGQEAHPSASITQLISDFFWELADLESGIWPTLVELTLRPGKVLQQYLSGVRAGISSPANYLLTAVVVDVTVERLFAWLGDEEAVWADTAYTSATDGGTKNALEVALDQLIPFFTGPETRIVSATVFIGLLTSLLYRLFGDILERVGKALAVASFLFAHVLFLAGGADLLYGSTSFLWVSSFRDSDDFMFAIILVGYVGFAAYSAFGSHWKIALTGTFVGFWLFVEVLSVAGTSYFGYAIGLCLVYPETYESIGAATAGFVVFALPLLLHVGGELYYRLR